MDLAVPIAKNFDCIYSVMKSISCKIKRKEGEEREGKGSESGGPAQMIPTPIHATFSSPLPGEVASFLSRRQRVIIWWLQAWMDCPYVAGVSPRRRPRGKEVTGRGGRGPGKGKAAKKGLERTGLRGFVIGHGFNLSILYYLVIRIQRKEQGGQGSRVYSRQENN